MTRIPGQTTSALVDIKWPEDLLGTVGRTCVLRFRSDIKSATLLVQQDGFLISGPGKVAGEDRFSFTFSQQDSFVRHLRVRSKKSENSAGKVLLRVKDDSGSEEVVQEFETSVSPLWGILEYLNLAVFWFWLPKALRRALPAVLFALLVFSVAIASFTYWKPDWLSDRNQERVHLAPPDWFETSSLPEWNDFFTDGSAPEWSLWCSGRATKPKDGYLDVQGVAEPRLPGTTSRDTLHDFYTYFDLRPDKQDAVSWAFRLHPYTFQSSDSGTIRWSAYVFRVSNLSAHEPSLGFYYCDADRRPCDLILAPTHLGHIDADANHLEVSAQGHRSGFTVWLKIDGKPLLTSFPFVDGRKRLQWGGVAFLSLDENLRLDPRDYFRLAKINIWPREPK